MDMESVTAFTDSAPVVVLPLSQPIYGVEILTTVISLGAQYLHDGQMRLDTGSLSDFQMRVPHIKRDQHHRHLDIRVIRAATLFTCTHAT